MSVLPCHGLPNQTFLGTVLGLPLKLTTTGRASPSSTPKTVSKSLPLPTKQVSSVMSVSTGAGDKTVWG
jgi:hypothetical protein